MKESEVLELKKSLATLEETIQTVVAFQNSHGGQIIIGVGDDGTLLGVEIGKNTLELLVKDVSSTTSPKIYPRISEEKINGKTVIRISVEEGKHKPYFCKGTAYKRVGRSNIKMDSHEIEEEILKRRALDTSFDSMACEATIDDIDENKLRDFLLISNRMRRSQYELVDIPNTLVSLGLISRGRLTNSAVLLFGKNPQRFFPQFAVRCGVFKGNNFLDLKLVEGSLIEMIENTYKFVLSYMKKSVSIEGARRIEKYEYPEDAVREAIINAIVHRDFEVPSSCYVSIYDDRIEIKNPGLTPAGLTLSDLKKESHPSLPRNKILAKMAYLAGYIEQYGTGTTKIIRLCREYGLKDPLFSEKMGFFTVSIYNSKPNLSKRKLAVISLLRRGGKISAKDYARKFKITGRYARKELSELEELGFITKRKIGRNVVYNIGTIEEQQ